MSKKGKMLTPQETYEYLKRSDLNTVLVEGKNDVIFYRKIEEHIMDEGFDIDIFPAGNKGNVLEVGKMLGKNPLKKKVLLLVDNDEWVHKKISLPDNVITTCGYSIENDAFCDGNIEKFLDRAEKLNFNAELDKFVRWYALALSRFLQGRESSYRINPNGIIGCDKDGYDNLCKLEEGEAYPDILYRQIKDDYKTLLRGKSLFSLILRQLSAQGRKVKFSDKQLLEIGASERGEKFSLLKEKIIEYFKE